MLSAMRLRGKQAGKKRGPRAGRPSVASKLSDTAAMDAEYASRMASRLMANVLANAESTHAEVSDANEVNDTAKSPATSPATSPRRNTTETVARAVRVSALPALSPRDASRKPAPPGYERRPLGHAYVACVQTVVHGESTAGTADQLRQVMWSRDYEISEAMRRRSEAARYAKIQWVRRSELAPSWPKRSPRGAESIEPAPPADPRPVKRPFLRRAPRPPEPPLPKPTDRSNIAARVDCWQRAQSPPQLLTIKAHTCSPPHGFVSHAEWSPSRPFVSWAIQHIDDTRSPVIEGTYCRTRPPRRRRSKKKGRGANALGFACDEAKLLAAAEAEIEEALAAARLQVQLEDEALVEGTWQIDVS